MVNMLIYSMAVSWFGKAGPTGAGIEFGPRGEEGEIAADAVIGAILVVVVEHAAEGALSPLPAGDAILFVS